MNTTEPTSEGSKGVPPSPWVYTEDKREEMFSIHTEGQDPIDCDNRFIVCGIWYQSSGREHGEAIAKFIINSNQQVADLRAALAELTEIVEEEFKAISIDDEWTHRKYNRYKSAIERAKKLAP